MLQGYAYEHGLGVEKNRVSAFEYYLMAARLGHPPAENNCGKLIIPPYFRTLLHFFCFPC